MSHQIQAVTLGLDPDKVTPPKSRELASVFDRLVQSNIQLTVNVGKLVRVTYGVLVFNAVLVLAVVAMMWRLR